MGGRWKLEKLIVLFSLESKKPALIPLLLYCANEALLKTMVAVISRYRLKSFIIMIDFMVCLLYVLFLHEGGQRAENNLHVKSKAVGLTIGDVQLLALFG